MSNQIQNNQQTTEDFKKQLSKEKKIRTTFRICASALLVAIILLLIFLPRKCNCDCKNIDNTTATTSSSMTVDSNISN